MELLSDDFREKVESLVGDFGYYDETQPAILTLCVNAAAMKLYGAGVLVQEENPEYLEAVMQLAAYRYSKRTFLATNAAAGEEDKGYTSMVHDYVHRLRYLEGDAG